MQPKIVSSPLKMAVWAVIFLSTSISAQEEILLIEPRVLSTDTLPGSEELFNSIDSIELLENGDIFFDAGSRRGNDDAIGLFRVAPTNDVTRVGQVGFDPFSSATAVPGSDFAVNNQSIVAFDAGFSAHLYKYDANSELDPYRVSFGGELPVKDFPSGITGSSFEGQFSGRLQGVAIDETGQIFFSMPFGGGGINPFLTGLFVNTTADELINIAYEGDPAPGIQGAIIDEIGLYQISGDDTFYSVANLKIGFGDVNSGNDFAIWRRGLDSLELVVQEGTQASGFEDGFSAFALFMVTGLGDQVVISGNVNDGQGTIIEAKWLGTGPSDFAPFVKASNSLDFPTVVTVAGKTETVFFMELRPGFIGSVLVSSTGDIFFSSSGVLESDPFTTVAGIWKRAVSTGEISLFVPETNEFHSFLVLDINSSGRLVFLARLGLFSVKDSLWFMEPNGTTTKVVAVDDELAG
ncbi:MAG: hypothetical protein O7C75_10630, partial [Verrucomicrobia bacterium]|nr:hypothetical protein [Verrucomicrobiota bacterium]